MLYFSYRLFLALYADFIRTDARLEFGRHYVLVGLVVALLWAAAKRELRGGWPAAALHLLALVLLPAVLFAAFGYEALLGLLLGFVVVQLLALLIGRFDLDPIFFPLVTVWALILPKWAGFLSDLSRLERAAVIVVAVLLVAVALWRAPAEGSHAEEV